MHVSARRVCQLEHARSVSPRAAADARMREVNGDNDRDEILDLGALTRPPKIVLIDGVGYPMVAFDELGVLDRTRVEELHKRIVQIEAKARRRDVSAKQQRE